MIDTILCIDIGTSSLKAALLSDKYTVEAYSRQEVSGSADSWLFALKKAIASMKEQNPETGIEAVCISGNGPTLVADSGGRTTTLLWNENPPAAEKIHAQKYDTKSIFIPRLKLFKEIYRDEWNNAAHILSAPEFLIYKLTGTALSILPDERFGTAYWTQAELLNAGFSPSEAKKIPPFARMGSFAGKISAAAAIATGLFEGTFVFCGAPDFIVAILGTGTVFPGLVCDRAGSSEGINLCTQEPVFDAGIRTLPHPMEGLWNASVLIEKSGTRIFESQEKKEAVLEDFARGIEKLRNIADKNKIPFSNRIVMTGGQCQNESFVSQKAERAGIRIEIPWCSDAELIGDLILARVALGDFDDIQEAAMCLCKAKKSYGNI
jgi:sugar (pentulose or hexulose) kinase